MARSSYTFIDVAADEARGSRQPRPRDGYSDSLARRRQLIEAQTYSYIDRIPLPRQQYRYLDIKSDELKGTFKADAESEQRLLYYGQLDRMRHISLEPSAPQVTHHRQARPWEVIPGRIPGEEAPPRTPSDQPIRGYEPRAPVPPGRPPPYPGTQGADRRTLRGSQLPEYEQPVPAQRTPPSSPVEDIVDDGQFQFSPPTSRRQLFPGSAVQQQAPLQREADVSGDFHFPAQPAETPAQEFATPPVERETEFEVPPVNASVPANQAEFEVHSARATMPAYQRGPSYASEVDNLAEPQVLLEDTILTPVAEGRYKRQRVTNGFSSSTGGGPTAGGAIPIHPLAGVAPARDVTLLYTWIDPRSEEFAIDISKGRSPTGHVTSTLPPVAPRTVVRRYIDAPMADVARAGSEAPVLAPQEPLEERAAAARERHALHQAEEEVQVRLREVDGRVSVAFTAPAPAAPESAPEGPAAGPQPVPLVSGTPSVPCASAEDMPQPSGARSRSRRSFSLLPFINPGGSGRETLPRPPPEPEAQPQPVDSVNRQSRFKRMFSRKPKERRVAEVNVLPTPVLVPPEAAPEPIPEVPPPPPDEVAAEEVTPPPVQELPAGMTVQETLPGTTRVITAQRPPHQPAPPGFTPDTVRVRPAAAIASGVQPGDVQTGGQGAGVIASSVPSLDISRMGGPERAEREAVALMDAAERATAPPPAPVSFEEEVTEAAKKPEMQSRAVRSQEIRVRGAAGYLAPMSHPPLGPGAAEAPIRRPPYEEGEAEEETFDGQEFEAPQVDVLRGRPKERIIIRPPAQGEGFPSEVAPAGVRQYEEQQEAEEGGQEIEVQEEGCYPGEQQSGPQDVWAPAEPGGRDGFPSRVELREQGVPGYANQDSFKTAREGWVAEGTPATERPIEHVSSTKDSRQAPSHLRLASATEASQTMPQGGAQPEPQEPAVAEQGPGEWPDVTLPGHEEGDAGGADTRGQATQTAYPEQPRTPPATPAQQAATPAAGVSTQRPSASAPQAGTGDQGHMMAGKAVPTEPGAGPGGEREPASAGPSAWAVPAAVQPGVPHVPPADSSDEEPEAEEDAPAAELSQEQPEHQQKPVRVEGRITPGTPEGQDAAEEDAGKKRVQDLDRQLRENAEQLRRHSAASQTGLGIALTAFGPLAVPSSAQRAQPGTRPAAKEKPSRFKDTSDSAAQPAAETPLTAKAAKTGPLPLGEAQPGGAPGRIVIGPPPHIYSPDDGYSTPPEEFAASSPQSFTSEGGSLQHAEVSRAGAEGGDGGSLGGSYHVESQLAAPGGREGGPQGGSYPTERQPLMHGEHHSRAEGGAAQAEEAAAGLAVTSSTEEPGTPLSAPRQSQVEGEPSAPRGSLLRQDTPSPSAFQRFRATSLPRDHTEQDIPEHEGEHEAGEHASPEEPWPGTSAEAQHVSADDSATWHADRASLQRALDQAIAQPIDPSRRPMWTDTSGVLETQGSDGTFYDAPEGQEQVPHEQRTAASEAPPVCQVTPPAPPSTPVVSPALSAAQIAPETPTKPRLPELPEEEMAPGRWHGASFSRAPMRSKSREELKQVIAGISSQKSEGEEAATMPAQLAPFPQDPEVQAAEDERLRLEDEDRREWESAQGAGPRAEGLQRQISFEEQRFRERVADLAEGTHRSMSEQKRRLQQIAGQGMTRIQKTHDEGIGKIDAVRQAAVEGPTTTTSPWPGTDQPTAVEARAEWERRIAASPTVPTGAVPAAKSEAGPDVRISQPAVRYSVPSGRAGAEQGISPPAASTQGGRIPASPFTMESAHAPVSRSQDDSEPLRPATSLKGQSRSTSLPEATSLEYSGRSTFPSKPLTAEEKGKGLAPSFRGDPGPSQVEWEVPEGGSSARSAQTQQPAPEEEASTGDSAALPAKREPADKKGTFGNRVKAMLGGGRRSGPPVKE